LSKRANKHTRQVKTPYFSNKRAAKRSMTLHATSNCTGLRHSFKNVEGWEQYSKDRILAKAEKEEEQLLQVVPFFNFIESFAGDLSANLKTYNQSVYRFANPMYSPTTIVGSIADGGRFNIGGAQVRAEFSSLNKAGCLYTASSKECAMAEAAIPHGTLKMYQLTPKKPLQLWGLNSVIKVINYPNLLDMVKAADGEALWVYRKIPAIPQILATKLRAIGGDGITFESTNFSGHSNIALFFRTDDESKAAFDVQIMQ
jgi:hypothetical protein